VLDDVDDFWDWIHSESLARLLKQQQEARLELDLDRILAAGDSAGGLLSVYLTLSQPDKIRAGTAAYPALSWDNPPLLPAKITEGVPPESFIEEYIANLKPGYVESSDIALQRVKLSITITMHQRGCGFFFRGASDLPRQRHPERLYQLARLDQPDAKLPRGGLVILHGTEDVLVLPEASHRFVNKARSALEGRQGADKVVLALRPGGHGFDVDTSLDEKWLTDALRTAVDTWLE
jgi:acetyl esterase/lipase